MNKRRSESGIAVPFVLAMLALLTFLVSRIYSSSQSTLSQTQSLVTRAEARMMSSAVEDFVIRTLPRINLELYRQLKGIDENAPISMEFPLPHGAASIIVSSANSCLNVAPLLSIEETDYELTFQLLDRLLLIVSQNTTDIDRFRRWLVGEDITLTQQEFKQFQLLRPYICYLPGFGQLWNIRTFTAYHRPLLAALLPEQTQQTLDDLLALPLDQRWPVLLRLLGDAQKPEAKLFTADRYLYWLKMRFLVGSNDYRIRDLIYIDDQRSTATVVRRRLIEDDTL